MWVYTYPVFYPAFIIGLVIVLKFMTSVKFSWTNFTTQMLTFRYRSLTL